MVRRTRAFYLASLFFFLSVNPGLLCANARLQCGILECFANPGVHDFSVHCLEQDYHSNNQTSAFVPSARRCKNFTPHVRVRNNFLEGGRVWNKTIRGSCRKHRTVRLMDTSDKAAKAINVCVRPSNSRYLVFDMNEGFANQVMSLVNAVYLAERFSFVLVLPTHIASRNNMHVTNPLHHSGKVVPFSALFDVETLRRRLNGIGVQATGSVPGDSNLQYISVDIPRRSSYHEVADMIGTFSTSKEGERAIVDVGNLFLKFTPDTCDQQNKLFAITRLVTSSFRKDISDSAKSIVRALARDSEIGTFNAIHLRVEEDSEVWTVTDFVKKTWEKRVLKAGFAAEVPIYVACGDSCKVSSSRFKLLQKTDFKDLLPPNLQAQDIAAALDFLVLKESARFAGSTFSAFSHMVVTHKMGRHSYDIYGHFSAPFQSSEVGMLSYGSCSPRQPCNLRTHEKQLRSFQDLGHAAELLHMRRVLLSDHGISPNSMLDLLVVLETLREGKRKLALQMLSTIVPHIQTNEDIVGSRMLSGTCSVLKEQQGSAEKALARLLRHAFRHYGIRCDTQIFDAGPSDVINTLNNTISLDPSTGISAALDSNSTVAAQDPEQRREALHVLFVTHNLLIQGAPLVMFSWLEYLVQVLRVRVDVLAPRASCDAAQPLQEMLLNAGVGRVFCGQNLRPRGYDVIYLNTIVTWFTPPDDDASSSWLQKTIWWVHESARALLFPSNPHTEKMLPMARKRIFVSNATQAVFSDLSNVERDTVVYNALHSNEKNIVLAEEARRQRLRETMFDASDDTVVFLLLGSVTDLRHQADFVKAGISVLRARELLFKPKCKFAIVGFDGFDPRSESTVRSIVAESKYADHFILLGKVDHDAAVRMVSVADVLVSVGDLESFGMTILEGMTFGLPLVVQHVDGVPEVAYEGAIHVNPRNQSEFSDAILNMLDSRARAWHRRKSAKRSQYFNKHVFLVKHLLGLAEIISDIPDGTANKR